MLFAVSPSAAQPPTTILQNADQLVNFADWLISDRERHFCPSWSEVFRVKEPSRSPICYGSKMCLKLGHIPAAIDMIRHFVAGLQISRRGKSKELRANLGLLTKASFAAAIAFIPTKRDAGGRHPIHLIILLRFMAAAERRQWSSAAAIPRRVRRVRLWPRFWIAKVPSHQICRRRRASLYSGVLRRCLSSVRAASK